MTPKWSSTIGRLVSQKLHFSIEEYNSADNLVTKQHLNATLILRTLKAE